MKHITSLLLAFTSTAALSGELPVQSIDSVIFLTKNTNNNQVHYGVRVDDSCRPLEKKPAYAYWRMLEEGPEVREDLKFWEEPGYGVHQPKEVLLDDGSGSFDLVIRGVPEREIRLETLPLDAGCGARAYSTINDREAILQQIKIYVSGWANVHKVEIFGLDLETGEAITEVTFEE